MARKGRQAVRNGGLPAWVLVLIGIIIGALAVWLVMRTGHMPISRPDNGPQAATAASEGNAGPGIATPAKPAKPKYDFYSLLPEKEVRIPDAQLNAQVKAEQTAGTAPATPQGQAAESSVATATPSAGAGRYLLQVASFSDASQAEALKARLALKGFRAETQPATIDGQTWYRVRLGPFATASALEAVKQKLEASGFHAMAVLEH